MYIKLYHGTSYENGNKIFQEKKLNMDLCGTQWGATYGVGIYLSPYLEEAKAYGECILEIDCEIEPIVLDKYYSPTNKNHKRQIRKISKIRKLRANKKNTKKQKKQ